jgi:hypothetical protein
MGSRLAEQLGASPYQSLQKAAENRYFSAQ